MSCISAMFGMLNESCEERETMRRSVGYVERRDKRVKRNYVETTNKFKLCTGSSSIVRRGTLNKITTGAVPPQTKLLRGSAPPKGIISVILPHQQNYLWGSPHQQKYFGNTSPQTK